MMAGVTDVCGSENSGYGYKAKKNSKSNKHSSLTVVKQQKKKLIPKKAKFRIPKQQASSNLRPKKSMLDLQKMPVAFVNNEAAQRHTGGKLYHLGRIKADNAFAVKVGGKYHVYVNTQYSGYRNLAKKISPNLKKDTHVDHVASRGLEHKIGQGYIRIAAVPSIINMAHGSQQESGRIPVREFNLSTGKERGVSYATKSGIDKLAHKMPDGRKHQAMTPERAMSYTKKDMITIKKSLFLDKSSQRNIEKMLGPEIVVSSKGSS